MATVTFFYEACPVCGRPLRVDIRYLGRWVLCSHCEGEFIAGQRQFPRVLAKPPSAATTATKDIASPITASAQPASPQGGCESTS